MSDLAARLRLWDRRELPLIQQSEAAECGIACLGMIAGYFGYRVGLSDLRQKFSISMEGCTLLDLMNFAEKLALASRPLRVELDDLKAFKVPVILHWDLNHFVVLKGIKGKKYIIHDPAQGIRYLSHDEVSSHFTGVVLELLPTKEFQQKDERQPLRLSDFWSRIIGLKRSLGLLFLLSLLLQVFVLAAPYYQQLVVDDVLMSADLNMLLVLAIGFAMLLLFEVATNALRGIVLLHFGSLMSIQMTANLFHHLVRLPVTYFEKRHMGDIITRFGSLQHVKDMLTEGIIEALLDGVMIMGVLILLYVYSPLLATVVVATGMLYALIRLMMYRSLREASKQEIIARAEENSNFMETVRGMQTIKLFGAEAKREGIWQNYFVTSVNRKIKVGIFDISFQNINRLLFGLENIIVIYLAAHLVLAGNFSVGMLFAFVAYKRQFMDKASRLVEKLIEFKMLNLHFERLSDVTLTEKEETQPDHARVVDINGDLKLDNVSFSYSDSGPKVIENLSLEVGAGESLALVGPSGCGKTTAMKVMLGLFVPQKGEVLVDGIPLERIGLGPYRRQIAAVMQDDQLLSGSISENIAFFEPNIEQQRVQECAEMAAIHEDISNMPMGYNSLIGDMGSSLSGGQKQRVLLARALYKQPRILFLDEATSHLDTDMEKKISANIRNLDITRVIIAHRPETIQTADRVVDLAEAQRQSNDD
ncbi:ATP-binding cassette subfamily B protein RaxB [Natronospira proteinivora]|uniref:ATP-binding cassette subfamily B protein RaxB n=1 Tax=Natronospira proteinivora TaxID=1807133 RepID=A0ABT1GAC1_9GAMM|nr:peptidase domain-containing ABC transporter [Natronospira proteinivora]MCP1728221.1 ATP-binding cassette subfamily B protein RaxB [Natronospira proteinivora]